MSGASARPHALLPPAVAEFVVVADTHLMDVAAPHAGEYASRARQNERVAAALNAAVGLGSGMIVHVGDLVQDYPESPLHEPLLVEAVRQWQDIAATLHVAAGNTDVGDQHDPATPAAPASPDSLKRFAGAAGGCWSAFDAGPLRGMVLTASLFNSGLDQEAEQWSWLEAQLRANSERRLALFFHYPLFLCDRADPGTGNYDVINEPARSRLLDLIERFGIELVVTGHSHFAFYNTHAGARLVGAPSTSFTRPGFSELFSSCPPPDRGRDDVPKLGFLLVRVHDDGVRVHAVRTGEVSGDADGQRAPLVSAGPADVPGSPLGVVLRHPVAQFAEVPDTFPSVVRQPVRNDYPLLACLELGARHVSVSVADAMDERLAERLALLRADGIRVVARVLWPAGQPPVELPADAPVDDVELMLLDRGRPSEHDLAVLGRFGWTGGVTLSVLVRRAKPGAELPRWRYGMVADEAAATDDALAAAGARRCRVLMAAQDAGDVASVNELARQRRWRAVDGVDVVVPVAGYGPDAAESLTASFLHAAGLPGGRIFVDSLQELDRTLDVNPGLLDRSCNPRPAFHALRILNSLLYVRGDVKIMRDGRRYEVSQHETRAVIVPSVGAVGPDELPVPADGETLTGVFDLATGTTAAPGDSPTGPAVWMFDKRAQ